MKRILISVFTMVAMTFLLGGCLSLKLGGGGRKTTTTNKSESYNVTLGQQLTDLKTAYDNGVINEKEYNAQRKKLLNHKF